MGASSGRARHRASLYPRSVPRVEARARCAAASPPERRSHELSGGGCNPVAEPRPASPRLIAGLSSSASAGPIGCTSGRCAFDFGALDLGRRFAGLFRRIGSLRHPAIWGESGPQEKRNHTDAHTVIMPSAMMTSTRPFAGNRGTGNRRLRSALAAARSPRRTSSCQTDRK